MAVGAARLTGGVGRLGVATWVRFGYQMAAPSPTRATRTATAILRRAVRSEFIAAGHASADERGPLRYRSHASGVTGAAAAPTRADVSRRTPRGCAHTPARWPPARWP